MRFTEEQEAILSSTGDIKINAVAGSGKRPCSLSMPNGKRPFQDPVSGLNRSVRTEAQKTIHEQGLPNVDVPDRAFPCVQTHCRASRYEISTGYKITNVATCWV